MKSTRLFATWATIAAVAIGCNAEDPSTLPDTSQPDGTEIAADHDRAPAPDAWRAAVIGVDGATSIEHRAPGATAWAPLGDLTELSPGSSIRTGPQTRARLAIEPGGEIILNHSSELTINADSPGALIARGHAVIHSPLHGANERRSPRIDTPTGSVELVGTSVSVIATQSESSIAVSQGSVLATDTSGDQHTASFGQQIILPETGELRVIESPDLAGSFGWTDFERANETLPTLERGMGKLIARRPRSEYERPLDLKRHKVKVRVQGMMAYTEITEVFHNPTNDRLEGLYRFPLPEDAQISRLALKVGDRIMEGQFLETARAERIWRDVTIERRRDPALLKWKQGNQFELRIFPIEPHSARQVTIGYVQRLQPSGQGYTYTYPMPIDRNGQTHTKKFELDAHIAGHDTAHPVTLLGYKGAQTARVEDTEEISMVKKDFVPSGDLSIRFALPEEAQQLRAYAYKDTKRPKDPGYVAFSMRPLFQRAAKIEGRDFVVILDSSYGRQGATMALQRALTRRIVSQIDPLDRVRILACSTSCVSVGERDWMNGNRHLDEGLSDALERLEPWGSTYTVDAVRSAARLLDARDSTSKDRPANIIYMTDGVASSGALDPGRITDATRRLLQPHGASMSVVTFGGEEDRTNLDALATGGNGQVISLRAGDTMLASALEILRHHYGAALRDVAIELPVGIEQVYPTRHDNILPGEEVLVVGRVTGDVRGDIKLRGTQAGQQLDFSWPVDLTSAPSRGNSFVPRLWAEHHIRDLELSGQQHRSQIIKLSKRFGILTRYTTLLALESEEMMREYNVSHQRHIDWKGDAAPEGKTADLLAGAAEAQAEEPADLDDLSDAFASGGSAPSTATKSTKKKSRKPMKSSPAPRAASGPARSGGKVGSTRRRQRRTSRDGIPRNNDPFYDRGLLGGREHCYQVTVPTAKAAAPLTNGERKLIERRAKASQRDPSNRTKKMAHIRALMRGGRDYKDTTRQAIEGWLEMNPMDPEAVVLRGQVALNEGDIPTAMKWLASAPDAAARATWLQTRLHKAYTATGDQALACAHRVSLDDTKLRRPANSPDILSCASPTSDDALFDDVKASTPFAPARPVKALSGRTVITAEWSTPSDIDIIVIEPNGRPLSWMSQRKRIKVAGVRSLGYEQLAIPSTQSSTYGIKLVRADGESNPVDVKLTVKHGNDRRVINARLTDKIQEVAELSTRSKRQCSRY